MQLIGANQGLGLLRDLAVFLRGKKLRRDRRVENVEKYLAQRRRCGGVGFIAHDVAD